MATGGGDLTLSPRSVSINDRCQEKCNTLALILSILMHQVDGGSFDSPCRLIGCPGAHQLLIFFLSIFLSFYLADWPPEDAGRWR